MKLIISPRRAAQILLLAVLFFTFVDIAAKIIKIVWGYEGLLIVGALFDTGEEQSIATWYASLTLLLCSGLLAAIAAAKKREGDRYTLHWGGLSAILFFLAVDEAGTIHETVGNRMGKYLVESVGYTPEGFFYIWVVPAAFFVLAILLAYLRFLIHLPKKLLLLFVVAGALFVGGALGMEILEAQQLSDAGMIEGVEWDDLPVNVKVWSSVRQGIEEALEMLGVVVLIYALLSYISSYTKEKELIVRIEAKGK